MRFYLRHWYIIGGILALILTGTLCICWNTFEMLTKLQLMSFIALLLHQFEEYELPGGEPAIMNIVLQKSELPDRFPLNQLSAMITNVVIAYPLYFLPVLFPKVIWLGLIPLLFGFGQLIIHGFLTNITLKSFYNPGLCAVVFLHIPIGIYYIYYVTINNYIMWTDWLFGVIGLVLVTVFGVYFVTYKLMPDKNTRFPFSEKEMTKFGVLKIR